MCIRSTTGGFKAVEFNDTVTIPQPVILIRSPSAVDYSIISDKIKKCDGAVRIQGQSGMDCAVKWNLFNIPRVGKIRAAILRSPNVDLKSCCA